MDGLLEGVKIFCPTDNCSETLRRWMETEQASLEPNITLGTQITVLYVNKRPIQDLFNELPGAIFDTAIVLVIANGSFTHAEACLYLTHAKVRHIFCSMPEKAEFIRVLMQLAATRYPAPMTEASRS